MLPSAEKLKIISLLLWAGLGVRASRHSLSPVFSIHIFVVVAVRRSRGNTTTDARDSRSRGSARSPHTRVRRWLHVLFSRSDPLCAVCERSARRSAKGKRSSTWPTCCVRDRLPLEGTHSRERGGMDCRAHARACRVTPTVVVRSRLGSGSGSGISLGAGPIKVARTYNSTIVVLFIADADCFNCSVPFVRVSRVLCSLHSTAGFKKIRSKKKTLVVDSTSVQALCVIWCWLKL